MKQFNFTGGLGRRNHRLFAGLIGIGLACLLVSGCATGVMLKHSPRSSFMSIRHVVIRQLPRGLRATSPNGREFFSNYFSPAGGFTQDGTDRRERGYAHVLILGDSRPYRSEVRVYRERKDSHGAYGRSILDKKLTKELASKIMAEVAKSREDRNIIDDFKVF